MTKNDYLAGIIFSLLLALFFACQPGSTQFGLVGATTSFDATETPDGELELEGVDIIPSAPEEIPVIDIELQDPFTPGSEATFPEEDNPPQEDEVVVTTNPDPNEPGGPNDLDGDGFPDPPDDVTHSEPEPEDEDGDGITNDDDDFPNQCTKLAVIPYGVSAAWIWLNGDLLVGPNSFPAPDGEPLVMPMNIADGPNTLSVRIAGSPGDRIVIQVWDCDELPSILLEEEVLRTTGKPNEGSESF